MWYQWQNGNVFIVTGWLCTTYTGSELQLNPTTIMSGASANISFTPPPVSLSPSQTCNLVQSRLQNSFHSKCFATDERLGMACYEYGDTHYCCNADRKNLKALSLQPLISLKDCKFDWGLELTARLQTHFTLCLNQFVLPAPVIKKLFSPGVH